jgi:HEAT repeat protein
LVIKGSSSTRIDALLLDLESDDALKRETAIARLTLFGARAVERLLKVVHSKQPPHVRAAAFRALEGIADPRALEPALRAVDDPDPGVVTAAIATSRAFIRSERGAKVTDRLAGVALDRRRDGPIRLAAIGVLSDLGPSTIGPLLTALRDDPSEAIRASAASAATKNVAVRDSLAEVTRAAEEGVSGGPAALRQAIGEAKSTAPLSTLLGIVERARDREALEMPSRRADWTAVRGAAHMALASRGSRTAVYDLRESLQNRAEPLPADFVSALTEVGDRSCLEPIAAAYARSTRPNQDSWRRQLSGAFRAIAKRERITRKHAVVKRIEKKWKSILDALWADGQEGRERLDRKNLR